MIVTATRCKNYAMSLEEKQKSVWAMSPNLKIASRKR